MLVQMPSHADQHLLVLCQPGVDRAARRLNQYSGRFPGIRVRIAIGQLVHRAHPTL
jgi:hypothetical protein